MTGCVRQVAELVRREAGIVLAASRETLIRAAVGRAAPGMADPCEFLRAASSPGGRDLVERLIDEVTVQESSFVRSRSELDAISWEKLLDNAAAAGSPVVRVWSAGCARGEESYTLALLAAEAFAPEPPPVDILGTDISVTALAKAEAARYHGRALRALEPPLLRRYFERQPDGSHLVSGILRDRVRFRRHNLAAGPFPPAGEAAFDLIVCRNVLIYLDMAVVARVIGEFERSLRPGGMLVLGAADRLMRPAVPTRLAVGAPARQAPGPPDGGGPATAAPPGPEATPEPQERPGLPGPGQEPPRQERLAVALSAADRSDFDTAIVQAAMLLAEDPLDADAHFVSGLVLLENGEPAEAVAALRRALYADESFALAAFELGRAYDSLGDRRAARRCYQQTLRSIDPEDRRYDLMLRQVDIGDIAAACRVRLRGQS